MKLSLLILSLAGVLSVAAGARILAVLPFPSKSFHIFSSAVITALTEKGHEVVEYSVFPPQKPIPNHTHVKVFIKQDEEIKNWTYEHIKKITSRTISMIGPYFIAYMIHNICEETFQDRQIQMLLKSDEHFDLVITQATFGESMLTFGHKFKAPTINFIPAVFSTLNRVAGNALSIATNADMASFAESDQLSFIKRALNLINVATTQAFYHLIQLPAHNRLIQKYYPGDSSVVPSVQDMVLNISLNFVHIHPAIAYVQPYTPNIIPIGGIAMSDDRSVLPKNLQAFMDEAKEGVIYFSFGTLVPTHLLPSEMLQIFCNVFGKLKQKVLWKINSDSLPGLPKNVRLEKWVPQPGVLAHTNTKVFLTHGGGGSLQDTIYAGVPAVGMAFFGDQPYNVKLMEHRGIGVKLDLDTLSEQSLHAALTEVLGNRQYRENAQRLSRIFRDRPSSPKESVVFWTEYVLRHQGAPHLRPVAAMMPWYQLALLDVVAFILLVISALLILPYLALRTILRRRKVQKVHSAKKKN